MQIMTICMKHPMLFSGKTKKNVISLSYAELAQRVVKVKAKHDRQKILANNILKHFYAPAIFSGWHIVSCCSYVHQYIPLNLYI